MGSSFIALVVVAASLSVCASRASASSSSSAHSTGMIGIRLIDVPGEMSSNPLGNSYIVARLAPGAKLSRTVEIDNDSSAAVSVKVYPAGANLLRGQFHFANGETRDSLAEWTSVESPTLRLSPHSDAREAVVTRVPFDAPAGEEYAVLWASVSDAPARGKGITLVSRVGVRMYVTVGKGGAAPSNFHLGVLRATRSETGESLLVANLRNTGANTLDLDGFVRLSDGPGNLSAGPFTAKLGVVLAPGRSENVTVPLPPRFPRGPWRADLNVSSGLLTRSTSDMITFPTAERHGGNSNLALDATVIPGAVLIGGIVSLMFMRRRQKKH